MYTYITDHMHPRWGVLAGWALLIAYVGTAASVSAGVTNYANVVLRDSFGWQMFPVLLTTFVAAIACYLAYRDIQISTRLMLWLQAASVALISFIAVGVIVRHGWRPDMAQLTLQGVTPEKLRLGLVLAIFSSVGFESATSLGSEARDPLISIPRAVKWSAILAGVFFFLCAYAEVLAFRGEPQSLGQSPAPMHVLAQQVGLPPLVGTLTDLGAVVTFFSCFLACITAAARVLVSDGSAWRAALRYWAKRMRENQTPHRAVLLVLHRRLLPAGIMTLRGMNLFEIYGLIGTLATFGFVTAYILVSRRRAALPALAGPLDAAGHRNFRSGDFRDVRRAAGQSLPGSRRAVFVPALSLRGSVARRLRVVHDVECANAILVPQMSADLRRDFPMKPTDRELGMDRPIKRRDFLNGVAVAIGAPLLGSQLRQPRQPPPGTYPPTLTGMRGLYPGSFTTAHALRDHTFWKPCRTNRPTRASATIW